VLTTRFTRLIGCNVPIQQAGMGGVATAELASAVALAGALGMIGGVRLGAKVLGEELDSLPRQTRSRIGVNFLVFFLDRESLEVAAESAAHPAYQEALLRAEPEDTILTEAYSANWPNAPHRVLRGCIEAAQALTDDLVGQTVIAGATLPLTRFMTPPPTRWSTGKIEAMPHYAGQSVGAVQKIQPAADIVRELAEGAERLLRGVKD